MQQYSQEEKDKMIKEANEAFRYFRSTGYKRYETMAKIKTVLDQLEPEDYTGKLSHDAKEEYDLITYGQNSTTFGSPYSQFGDY